MRKLEEIEEQIRNLSGTDLVKFRKWFAEFDAQAWDNRFEADVKSGKLDALGEETRQARREGKSKESFEALRFAGVLGAPPTASGGSAAAR